MTRIITLLLLFSLILNSLFIIPASVYAASSPFSQTDWSGGSGQTAWSDSTKFDSSSSVTTSVSGQTTLAATSSWYNTSWAYRRKVTFDNSSQAGNLTNFPVLVKLDSTRVNYSNTQNSGQDIRFTDSDGTTLLSYEIEKWDETGSSFVWVKVPQVDSSSATDYIYIYYGNTGATDAQAATSVWDSNYVGVWHLKEDPSGGAPQMLDSTSNNNDGTSGGTMTSGDQVTGQVNGSLDFDGTDDSVTMGDINALDGVSAVTYEAWVKPNSPANLDDILGKWSSSGSNGLTLHTFAPATEILWGGWAGNTYLTTTSGFFTNNVWHFLAGTFDGSQPDNPSRLKLYGDGALQSAQYTGTVPTTTPDTAYDFRIAADSENGRTFPGILDEVRISNVARSAAWIAASYKSEADTFNTYASEEGYYNTTPGTLTSSIFDTEYSAGAAWGTLTYNATTPSNTSVSVKARTSNSSSMTGATAFSSCTAITSGSDISSNSCVTDSHRYIQYQLSLANTNSVSTPTFQDVSIAFSAYDSDAPSISLTALSPDPNSDSTPTLSGTATESIGTVSNVQFQMDATSGSWTACTATDGSFNSASEAFSCTPSALSDGSHTMYVRATDSNSNTTSNASASTDTFTIDVTAPASFDLDSPGHESYTGSERPTFKWKATTDATSGLSSYTLEIDNGASGDFSITGIPTSRTTDYDTSKYLVHYDGSYISIYTKSSSSWGSSENDGKLKEGSVGWKIKAIDSAGNERSEGRTVIVDLTGPVITTSGVGSGSPEVFTHDGYTITTNQTPTITGTITDNYSPDKVEISIYKENYFLGVITSKELFASLTYSLSNGANQKSLSFSIPVSDSLDFGSYEVNIKGTDKAGNKSALSTIYLKVLTSRQAQELLRGKVDKEDKKTIQEKSQVSLPRLEEKAKERREKEAEELEKSIAPLFVIANEVKQSLTGITNQIASSSRKAGLLAMTIGDVIELRLAQLSSMTVGFTSEVVLRVRHTSEVVLAGAGNTLRTLGSGMMTASNNFNQMVSSSQSVIASEAKQSLADVSDQIASSFSLLAMTIGQGYNNLAHSAPGMAGTILKGAGNGVNNIIRATARTYHKNIIVFKETSHFVRRIMEGAADTVASSVSEVATGIYQTSGVLLTGAGQGFLSLDQALEVSQENTKQAINKSSQEVSGNFRAGISSLAFAIGERVQDVSDRAGFTIVKFGYLFVNEPTKIYDIQVATLSSTSVKVSWRTNHPANGKVNWGFKDGDYDFEQQTSKRTTDHEFTLTNLNPGTEYHYEVMSQNKNYVYDANRKFRTPQD